MTTYPVKLFDTTANALVEANLHDEIGEKQLIDWQFQWQPAAQSFMECLAENGITQHDPAWPQSWHWDWRGKMSEVSGLISHTGYSVECCGVTQGMMRLNLTEVVRVFRPVCGRASHQDLSCHSNCSVSRDNL